MTVGDSEHHAVTDFELAASRPLLDGCKNDGWLTHPAGIFKNQGACIAAIVAAN